MPQHRLHHFEQVVLKKHPGSVLPTGGKPMPSIGLDFPLRDSASVVALTDFICWTTSCTIEFHSRGFLHRYTCSLGKALENVKVSILQAPGDKASMIVDVNREPAG